MIEVTEEFLAKKILFVKDYMQSKNAASASQYDANANVSSKNIATLESEINKDINIQINRSLVCARIESIFGKNLADEYLRQIRCHEIYVHDETSLKPYCTSISLYPFLLNGLRPLGGESGPPTNIHSFTGSFTNLVFAISSQFAGAIATVEFLMYFDYFAQKTLGQEYLEKEQKMVNALLQAVVYSINQPAAARGYQAVFWNITVFDKSYFQSMFENFRFPDGATPNWRSVDKLQRYFLSWFNNERQRAVLTFPVITAAMLVDDQGPLDHDFADMVAQELSEGNSFFVYQSKHADSLSSCCRLRNELNDRTFSYSLGAGGVATGSINVITLNLNRLVQDGRDLKQELQKIHKYQVAYRSIIEEFKNANLLPVYSANYISIDKQFLTVGINGLVEAAEFKGIKPGNNAKYYNFVRELLGVIYSENQKAQKSYHCRFNTEMVPAENLGVKNAKWDKLDGYFVPRECYNSYFYPVEDHSLNAIDKFAMHGRKTTEFLDGGAALHLNLDEHLSKRQYRKLLDIAATNVCNYFCINVKITICNQCFYIAKETRQYCHKCGSRDVDYGTRIIGYLKRVSSFSEARQKEHELRYYHKEKSCVKQQIVNNS